MAGLVDEMSTSLKKGPTNQVYSEKQINLLDKLWRPPAAYSHLVFKNVVTEIIFEAGGCHSSAGKMICFSKYTERVGPFLEWHAQIIRSAESPE